MSEKWRSTTILAIRRGNKVVVCGDGQVSFGNTIIKATSQKVRKIADGNIVAGYAGSASDGMALLERLEMKLSQYSSQLMRACIELAKDWRSDKFLRRLEAMLIVADVRNVFIVTGVGDVLEPEYGVAGIGSGGSYAVAAARALMDIKEMDIVDIAHKAMAIAASICVFTNSNLVTEVLNGSDVINDSVPAVISATNGIIPIKNVAGDIIYSIVAVISVFSQEMSINYAIDIIKKIFPALGGITLKTKQAFKRLVAIDILRPISPEQYEPLVHDLESLKSKSVDFSGISSNVINTIREIASGGGAKS